MAALLLSLLGLAIVDSVNPSALAVTVYLLTGPAYRSRVLTYLSGVFAAYLTIGVLLMLGLDAVADELGQLIYTPAAYWAQLALGTLMLLYGVLAPSQSKRQRRERVPRSQSLGAAFVLGLTVTVVEIASALPYFAAIGLMTNAGLDMAQWLPILVVYNIIFVLPPLLLLAARLFLGSRLDETLERLRGRLSKRARTAWLTILAIVGFLLVRDALAYFEFFGLFDLPMDLPDS